MARITVEDCIGVVPDRFEMVLLAAHRARQLGAGAEPGVDPDGDSRPVIALREIARGAVDPAQLRESLITSLRRIPPEDRLPEDEVGDRFEAGVVGGPNPASPA